MNIKEFTKAFNILLSLREKAGKHLEIINKIADEVGIGKNSLGLILKEEMKQIGFIVGSLSTSKKIQFFVESAGVYNP